MRKTMIFMLTWLPLLPAPAWTHANESGTLSIVKSNPPKGELVILVGKNKEFLEQPSICGNDKNCWAFDSHYIAKLHVEKVLAGELPEKDIEVDFYYHSATEPFYHADYALVFLRKSNNRLVEVKYQSTAIYWSAGDGWAICLDSPSEENVHAETARHAKPRVLLNWIDFYNLDQSPSKPVKKRQRFRCKQSLTAEQVARSFIRHDEILQKEREAKEAAEEAAKTRKKAD